MSVKHQVGETEQATVLRNANILIRAALTIQTVSGTQHGTCAMCPASQPATFPNY